jgi:hypothetical protein
MKTDRTIKDDLEGDIGADNMQLARVSIKKSLKINTAGQ